MESRCEYWFIINVLPADIIILPIYIIVLPVDTIMPQLNNDAVAEDETITDPLWIFPASQFP